MRTSPRSWRPQRFSGSNAIFTDVLLSLLIALLSHDRFAIREAAHKAIVPHVGLAVPHLLKAEKCGDCETARRASSLLAPWFWANGWRLAKPPPGWRVYPWISSIPADWPDRWDVMHHYLALARDKVGGGGDHNDWLDYREAGRLFLVDLAANRIDVGSLAARMADGDRRWCADHHQRCLPDWWR